MKPVINLLKIDSVRVSLTFALMIAGALAQRGGLLGKGSAPDQFVTTLANTGPNQMERDLITKNYYEQLVDNDRNPEWNFGDSWVRPWIQKNLGMKRAGESQKKENWGSIQTYGATENLPTGFLEHRLLPNVDIVHKGVQVKTNRWGHRDDDDYDKAKPPRTFRISVCGSSNSFGEGVERQFVFDRVTEQKLNDGMRGEAFDRFEVINHSVSRYHLLERVYVAENEAPQFQPDLILVAVTMRDLRAAIFSSVVRRVKEGRDLHFGFLRDVVERADVHADQSESRINQRLQPYATELAAAAIHDLREFSERSGIPVALMIMRLEVEGVDKNLRDVSDIARKEGLMAIELFDAYEGRTGKEMYLIPSQDFHPKVAGHAALAEELYNDLIANATIRQLMTTPKE